MNGIDGEATYLIVFGKVGRHRLAVHCVLYSSNKGLDLCFLHHFANLGC